MQTSALCTTEKTKGKTGGKTARNAKPAKPTAVRVSINILAERVGFEPTCRLSPTIRFRVGAVMTASVPPSTKSELKGLANTPIAS